MMAINVSDVGPGIGSLGELIGLLVPDSDQDTYEINSAWFQNPVPSLEQIGTRLSALSGLIAAVLGPADTTAPAVFDGANWYSIPNPATANRSGLWIVSSPANAASGELGLGSYFGFSTGEVSVTVSVYLPLFSYDSTGAQLLVGSTDTAIQLALIANSTGPIQDQQGATFTGLEIASQFYLADQSPSFTLSFTNLTGTTEPSTYNSLSALKQGQVLEWMADILTAASGWLDFYTPSPNFTYGDILEASNFVSRDYTFQAGNFYVDDSTAPNSLSTLVTQIQTTDSSTSLNVACQKLWSFFASGDQKALQDPDATQDEQIAAFVDAFNSVIANHDLSTELDLTKIELSPQTQQLIADADPADALKTNRLILQNLFPTALLQNPYQLDLQNLEGSPTQIGFNFVNAALSALATTGVQLASLPNNGSISITKEISGDDVTYGLCVSGSCAVSSPDPATNGASAPTINLSFGTLLSGDSNDNNWLTRSAGTTTPDSTPGISLFGITFPASGTPTFSPRFVLGSVGLDFLGSNGQPLINLDGFTLGGAEIRFYLNSNGWQYGFAAKLDGLGVPLGPGFNSTVSSSDTDPVAQSLLESGSTNSATPAPNAINPAFSVAGSYLSGGGAFAVQLYDANDAPANVVNIPIQRAFGPLLCQSLGIGWVQDNTTPANDQLSFLFNGSVEVGPLEVDLTGLSIGIPVVTPTDTSSYTLDLQGLGVSFEAGSVELSAALVKVDTGTYPEYDGEVLIKAGTFAINAIGSYAQVTTPSDSAGFTSLFAVGVFDGDLGGPACFFITGLAAGFGYNRSLTLPDINGVATYPLVVAASDPTKLGGTPPDPAKALQGLDTLVPPDQGEYWLAAGVRFTSYDLINSTALLSVEFGNELEISLLGLSWISLPPPAAPGASTPTEIYAYAELAIEVEVLPDQGEFTATAILTPNSFVIDPACHLTGGFAFYVWFGDNPYAGQFVLTLGGYNPAFQVPSYFPQVPRLGFNWALPDNVTIQGDAYFALTASAVMAGGGLQVLYAKGNLSAWFTAEMDALIQWAPFHYNIYIGVGIGASYRATILGIHKTFTVSLSASVNVWGPKMGGTVHVHWFIISFTVGFGADDSAEPAPLEWTNDDGTGFAQTLQPHQTSDTSSSVLANAMVAGAAAAVTGTVTPAGIYSITPSAGLLSSFTDSNNNTVWVVRGNQFVFSMTSTIPCTELDLTEPSGTPVSITETGYTVSFRPMNATLSSSVITLTLYSETESATSDFAGTFDYEQSLQAVPAAKYGQPLPSGQDPEMNEQLPGRLMGLSNITAKPPTLTPSGSDLLAIDVATAFLYFVVDSGDDNYLPLSTQPPAAAEEPQVDPDILATITSTMTDATVVAQRTALFQALQAYGVNPQTNGDVTTFAANPGNYLVSNPLVTA